MRSIWFDAIHHSFAVSDWERVVRLISANIFALLEQNELTECGSPASLTNERAAPVPGC
jgi:hypothetical protein